MENHLYPSLCSLFVGPKFSSRPLARMFGKGVLARVSWQGCLGKGVLARVSWQGVLASNASQGQEFEIDGMERPDCRRDETAALLAACVRSGAGVSAKDCFRGGRHFSARRRMRSLPGLACPLLPPATSM